MYIHGYTWYIIDVYTWYIVVYCGISMDIPRFMKPDFAQASAAGLIQCAHACGYQECFIPRATIAIALLIHYT